MSVSTKAMLLGLAVVFALFQWLASVLGSVRGEAGVIVGMTVVAALLVVQRYLSRESFPEAARAIGLARPLAFGLVVGVVISTMLVLVVPIYVLLSGSHFNFFPGWLALLPGLFFQAGIAEETLFRGYLFGHLRRGHTFWKAASFAAVPFVLVHLIMFYTLPWQLAAASILLAITMSFPLSKLYELGGNTIWAPAILHFVAQGTVKVIVLSAESAALFPFVWIAASAVIPWSVFGLPVLMKLTDRRRPGTAPQRAGL